MTVYNSHIKNLRIVITPARPIFEGGTRVGDTVGKYVQFEGGQFQTEDKKTIEKLEDLPTFGIDFWRASDKAEEDQKDKGNTEPKLESLTRQELLKTAQDKGLEVSPEATKKELLELLKSK